ncbi:MAG: hypothetical protein E7634_06570 [Ruminococcaceae bacterium]|nr:hypothetical protein [Oscillospiraceae bacterium]
MMITKAAAAGVYDRYSFGKDFLVKIPYDEKKNAPFIRYEGGRKESVFPREEKKKNAYLISYEGDSKEVVIPSGIKYITKYAFLACEFIKRAVIPDTVEEIHECAFEFCSELESIYIPAGVKFIGKDAFRGCKKLKTITVDKDNEEYYSAGNCIIEKSTQQVILRGVGSADLDGAEILNHENEIMYVGSTLVKATDKFSCTCAIIKEGTKNISAQAFKNCKTLTRVYIPESVTRIGREAFKGCENLKTVDIAGNVPDMGDSVLSGCHALEEIRMGYIGGSDFENGEYAFEPSYLFGTECYKNSYPVERRRNRKSTYYIPLSLKTILLGNGVQHIIEDAFEGYRSLERVYISESVESISESAFNGCESLKNVEFCEDNLYFYDDSKCVINTGKETVIGKIVPSADFDQSDAKALPEEDESDKAVLEDGVVYLGNTLLKARNNVPPRYTVKSGTKVISAMAFKKCRSIVELVLCEGVESIGYDAFEQCENLKRIYIPDSITYFGSGIIAGCSSLEELRIPIVNSPIFISDGNGVYYAGDIAGIFYGYSENSDPVYRVLFPDLGKKSYTVYRFLSPSVSVPSSLTHLTLGNITSLSGLDGFKSLKSISFPDTVTMISSIACRDCESLESIAIPDSVTYIGDHAFFRCRSLREMFIPQSVKVIKEKAFAECTALESVSLPKGVEVAEDAFENCPNLKITYRNG